MNLDVYFYLDRLILLTTHKTSVLPFSLRKLTTWTWFTVMDNTCKRITDTDFQKTLFKKNWNLQFVLCPFFPLSFLEHRRDTGCGIAICNYQVANHTIHISEHKEKHGHFMTKRTSKFVLGYLLLELSYVRKMQTLYKLLFSYVFFYLQ